MYVALAHSEELARAEPFFKGSLKSPIGDFNQPSKEGLQRSVPSKLNNEKIQAALAFPFAYAKGSRTSS